MSPLLTGFPFAAGGLGKATVTGTTGSPSVDTTTRAGKTIYNFTGSGSITVGTAGTCEVFVLGGGGGGGQGGGARQCAQVAGDGEVQCRCDPARRGRPQCHAANHRAGGGDRYLDRWHTGAGSGAAQSAARDSGHRYRPAHAGKIHNIIRAASK